MAREIYEGSKEYMERHMIKFGNYFTWEGVPQIELIVPKSWYDTEEDEDVYTDEYKKVYLSAFRRYSFQVSMGRHGSIALGESAVFGMETFTSIESRGSSNLGTESTIKYFISCVAMDAIRNYCYNSYGYGLMMPNTIYNAFIRNNDEWDKFIDNVYKFARHEDVELNELDLDGNPIEPKEELDKIDINNKAFNDSYDNLGDEDKAEIKKIHDECEQYV